MPVIQKSIIIKNHLLKRFINAENLGTKETFHRQYKYIYIYIYIYIYEMCYQYFSQKIKTNYDNQYFKAIIKYY